MRRSALLLLLELSALPSTVRAAEPAIEVDPDWGRIVPPILLRFSQATYPPAAREQGLEGRVVLKLDIEKNGEVSGAQVLESAGQDFDEAAREAALRFEFAPAMRDGTPVRAQIRYEYSFTLERPPAPAHPRATISNSSPAGSGTPSEPAQLEPAAHEAEPVEVVVAGERAAHEPTRRTIERREIERVPGTGGDALRSLQTLPGVSRTPAYWGILVVRGSAPNDTRVFVDGTPVPIAYHFSGLSSVVPSELLARIDLFPGNFSARFGGAMGGVVDIGLREPDVQCRQPYGARRAPGRCAHGLLQVDLVDARALVQAPLPWADGWSVALGGRRSWLDAWIKPVLEGAGSSVTHAPVYYDYQASLERRDDQSRFSLRAFGSDDRVEVIVTDPAAQNPGFAGSVRFATSFYRLQAVYDRRLSARASIRTVAALGRDRQLFAVGSQLSELVSHPISLKSELSLQVRRGVKLDLGLDFLVLPFDLTLRQTEGARPGEPNPGPAVTLPLRESQLARTQFRPGWFTELELQPGARWRIVPGFRLDQVQGSAGPDFSPRLAVRYDVTPAPVERRTTLAAAVGLYHQPPELVETTPVFGAPRLASNRSVHYSLGVERKLSRLVQLDVTGFYKSLTRLVGRGASSNELHNRGTGSVVGVELLLRHQPSERFFGWIAYTLARSMRRAEPGAELRHFEFAQTHNLLLLGSYRFDHGWELGAKFQLTSGNRATPVVAAPDVPALLAADAAAYTPLEGAPYSEALPLYHQLDLRVDKRWQFQRFACSVYLDVQNAYANQAAQGLSYNYNYSKRQYQVGIPLIPSLGLRGEF